MMPSVWVPTLPPPPLICLTKKREYILRYTMNQPIQNLNINSNGTLSYTLNI